MSTPYELKLGKHMFVEASAGTGKTHKIMEIISELIREPHNIDLTSILILTYTEKAAGELKERLRKKLISTGSIEECKKLDQTSISTIHGFCNSILNNYPLETNTVEDAIFIENTERAKQAIYTLQHKNWFGRYDGILSVLLEESSYFGSAKKNILLPILNKFLSGRPYSIEKSSSYTIDILSESDLKEIQERSEALLNQPNYIQFIKRLESIRLAGDLNKTNSNYLFRFWEKMNDSLRSLANENKMGCYRTILEWRKLSRESKDGPATGIDVLKPVSTIYKKDTTEDIRKFIIDSTEEWTTEIKKIFDKLPEIDIDLFLKDTVHTAIRNLEYETDGVDWINYDKMIVQLRDTIQSNPEFKKTIQARYKVGIIDEFQDTDSIQYSIFKEIFLDSSQKDKSLILIGDPKQSIYGFRGADIGTYLKAKEELTSLGADIPTLECNYRSVKELIDGYNFIFSGENGSKSFFPILEAGFHNKPIEYKYIQSPEIPKYLLDDKFPEQPIHLVQLTKNSEWKGQSARDEWSEFIVDEIHKITDRKNPLRYIVTETSETKSINYGDIAILVKSRAQGIQIESLLKLSGIPCSFYKQPGIYESRESYQILNIFDVLLNPHQPASYRKLLMSDIFSIDPKYLNYFDEHSIESHEKELLNRWRSLAKSRKFAELFRSLQEESKIFLIQDEYDIAWERKSTNYRQIFRSLLQYQIDTNSGLEELRDELIRLQNKNSSEEEAPLFEKETEQAAVQILTIHASKGLEWPVVFLVNLSGRMNKDPDLYDYPTTDLNGNRVWKLSLYEKDSEALKIHNSNEEKRQLYVAITRPMVRLYLPYFEPNKDFKNSSYYEILFPKLKAVVDKNDLADKRFSIREYSSSATASASPRKILKNTITDKNGVAIQPNIFVESNRIQTIRVNSYSSLKNRLSYLPQPASHTIRLELDEKRSDNFDENSTILTDETVDLPSSNLTGLYLHKLLEELEFSEFSTDTAAQLEENLLYCSRESIQLERWGLHKLAMESENASELLSLYKKSTREILWNTCNSEFEICNSQKIKLVDIPKSSRIPEMDFYLDLNQFSKDRDNPGNYLNGSMDLVFHSHGKFYIADYKSNYSKDYNYDRLVEMIEQNPESRYDLQRDIYGAVLFQYLLTISDTEEEAFQKFGGVYFFFLRGMKKGTQAGIYAKLDGWSIDGFKSTMEKIQSSTNLEGVLNL
jgi:exodeoxyribonuclease V beta subunit